MASGLNPTYHLFSVNFSWNTAMSLFYMLPMAVFFTAMAELGNCNRNTSLKTFTLGSLQKKLADPDRHCVFACVFTDSLHKKVSPISTGYFFHCCIPF